MIRLAQLSGSKYLTSYLHGTIAGVHQQRPSGRVVAAPAGVTRRHVSGPKTALPSIPNTSDGHAVELLSGGPAASGGRGTANGLAGRPTCARTSLRSLHQRGGRPCLLDLALLKIAIAGCAIKRQRQRVGQVRDQATIARHDGDRRRRIVLRTGQRGQGRQHNHWQHHSEDHPEPSQPP